MLVREHGDVAKLVWRYGRWHHFVDYKPYAVINKLVKKDGIDIKKGVNNYGLKLKVKK